MHSLGGVVEEIKRTGCNKRKADMLEKDLDKVEQIMEKVADLYDKAVPHLELRDKQIASEERDRTYEDVDKWI